MKSRKRLSAMLSALTGLAAYLVVVSCQAADRSSRSIDSGQPRDLINQPLCCSPEQPDDSGSCDFARI